MHNEETYKQGERQLSELEKIIANEATDKQLISKICTRHLSNLLLWWYLKATRLKGIPFLKVGNIIKNWIKTVGLEII